MARGSSAKVKPTANNSIVKTLVLDVGAHSIKAGYTSLGTTPDKSQDCHVIQNCIAYSARDKRTYIGSQMDDCMDFGELAVRRPVEKGYIVNWEGEKVIWESSILNDQAHGLASDPTETNLILTEAPQAPVALQRHADEMVFEEFGFANYARVLGPTLPAYSTGEVAECLFVVDIGHSHTTFTPLLSGRPLHSACRRLDVGGKVLTNHLKDLISTRQLEMQKEFPLVEQIKEDTCYVVDSSQTFAERLNGAWKGGLNDPKPVDTDIVVEYMLPDYEAIKRGHIQAHTPNSARDRRLGLNGQIHQFFVVLGNERFAVPELLFSPMDIGMHSPGLSGTIIDSMESLPKGMWQAFLANILVVGGTSRLPGLAERLQSELRQSLDERFMINVRLAEDPLKAIWQGGAQIAASEQLMKQFCVSKAEYLEHGDAWLRRVFAGKVPR